MRFAQDLVRRTVTNPTFGDQPQIGKFPIIPALRVRILWRFRDDHRSPDTQELSATLRRYRRRTEGSCGHELKRLHKFWYSGGLLHPSFDNGSVAGGAVPFQYLFKEFGPFDHGIGEHGRTTPPVQ